MSTSVALTFSEGILSALFGKPNSWLIILMPVMIRMTMTRQEKNNGSIFQSFLFSVTLTFNDIQSNMIMCGNVLPLTTIVANMMTRFVMLSEKYIQVCFNYCL